MAINRGSTPSHKFWDHIGRITPNFEKSEGIRPWIEATPAAWLPVSATAAREETEIEAYLVVSAGKVIAEDGEGRLVPAGLRKAFNKAAGTTVLTYTALDVTEGVTDLTTGEAVAAAATYTQTQVTNALRERGLIRADEYAMDFISKPVGVAPYNYYQPAGSDHYNPANLRKHNYRPQATTSILCDYAVEYPLVPALETTETMNGAFANLAGSIDWSGTPGTRTGGWFGSTAIHGLVKYADSVAAGDDVVCYVFEKWPLAVPTEDTPITPVANCTGAGLSNEVDAVTSISADGDYFVDTDLGILFLYEAGGNTYPDGWGVTTTVTYYTYEDVVEAGRTTSYACATGNLNYGDFLTYDENSNLVRAVLDIGTAEGYDATGTVYTVDPEYDTEAVNATVSRQLELAISNHFYGIVGQVIGTEIYPKDYLDRVRTAYVGQTNANMRTPGTATYGRTDQLTYANAAERMVLVNLIWR